MDVIYVVDPVLHRDVFFLHSSDLVGLTKYPYMGKRCEGTPASASSVHHACLMSEELCLIMRPMAYIAMAGGSPWVVPSQERVDSPSIKRGPSQYAFHQ